jgi:hypothetical protein
MKSLRNLASRPVATPLAADDVVEFHAGRLLLLLSTCGGSTGAISGLTKMAKLDFFVRYPDFFRMVETRGQAPKATGAVEAAMVRHHYGPWDKRYYHLLSYLEARQLIAVKLRGKSYRIALTALGRQTAKKLAGSEAFRDLLAHMQEVNEKFGRKTGNELKNFIYETFGEEVAEQKLGNVIVGAAPK